MHVKPGIAAPVRVEEKKEDLPVEDKGEAKEQAKDEAKGEERGSGAYTRKKKGEEAWNMLYINRDTVAAAVAEEMGV